MSDNKKDDLNRSDGKTRQDDSRYWLKDRQDRESLRSKTNGRYWLKVRQDDQDKQDGSNREDDQNRQDEKMQNGEFGKNTGSEQKSRQDNNPKNDDDKNEQENQNQEGGNDSQYDRYDKSGNYRPDPEFSAVSKFRPAMCSPMFRKYGHQIIDWAVEYMKTLKGRKPTSNVKPGWLWKVVPKDPPQRGESFDKILKDLEEVACKGMAHWQHRQFFAYFPAGNSWPSILGDILSNATAANGQAWVTCPVMTELETIVMDWCCKFLRLPRFFLSNFSEPESLGQGVLQCSASEAIFYSMIWARQDALKKLRKKYPEKTKAALLNMLVAYCNNECHCCVERAALMGSIRMRKLTAGPIGVVRSHTLKTAILEDMKKGFIPFYHCAIIGSTGVTCCDDLMEVGPICDKFDMWLHVDAAYAGSSFVLPEMHHLKQGFEYAMSTNINTNKWMMTNFEASLHWVRDKRKAVDCFAGDPKSVRTYPNGVGPDLRHYGVSHSRRLRAAKLYFVIRNYGVKGIRRYIRNHINLAKLFEMYVRRDPRFEVVGGPFRFGLVTFRLKGYNSLTSRLLDAMNASHRIHMVSSHFHNQVVIRFALCAEHANEFDVDRAWQTVDEYASVILRQYEKEHAEDLALKALYYKQHVHDDMRTLFPNSEIDEEEAEAADVVRSTSSWSEDGAVCGAEAAGRDGNWGYGLDKEFEEYDKYLREHPEEEKDECGGPLCAPQSMLHLSLIKETVANHPENKSNSKLSNLSKSKSQPQQEEEPTRYY